jgi:hypothetical protein
MIGITFEVYELNYLLMNIPSEYSDTSLAFYFYIRLPTTKRFTVFGDAHYENVAEILNSRRYDGFNTRF